MKKAFIIFTGQHKCAFTLAEVFSTHFAGQHKCAFTLAEVFSTHFAGQRKYAFTLAEVLITLGIIGVVAAMTLPALIQNYKNKVLETQLKTAYADLNKASMMFKVHNGVSVSEYASTSGSRNTLKLFMKEFTFLPKYDGRVYNTVDEEGNSDSVPYAIYTLRSNDKKGLNCDVSGYSWDPQGRVISFDDGPVAGQNGPKVCIDINGYKKPNRRGMDYFVFLFTVDGQVIPIGQAHKNNPKTLEDGAAIYVNSTVANPANYCKYSANPDQQFACSYFALTNTHPQGGGRDYWHDFLSGK